MGDVVVGVAHRPLEPLELQRPQLLDGRGLDRVQVAGLGAQVVHGVVLAFGGRVWVMGFAMTRATARRGRPGHDQQAVLRVAVDLFNRQGYDATSVGDVARELGLTKSAIYHHVPSKEHLLQSAIDEALDALTAALDEVSATAASTPASGCAPRCTAA